MHRIFTMPYAQVHPLYVNKVIRKGRTEAELQEVVHWLTGYNKADINKHLKAQTTFQEFFAKAKLNPNAELVTGTICGVKIQELEDPLMKKIRILDKLVDELAKGRPMEKILRK